MSEPTPNLAARPGTLAGLTLRNRVIKSATYEGMSPGGVASEALIQHHQRLAKGGVGMTTVAYCAVSSEGRTFGDQLQLSEESQPVLRRLTEAVHKEGAAASLQLGHCGGFSKLGTPRGPSRVLNRYGLASGKPWVTPMDESDITRTIEAFATAAHTARELGFDAVELHLGHGYLLSQFLSPMTNRRNDRWGGSLENRMRLPLAVVDAVRERVGADFPILAKVNLRDGCAGGFTLEDSVVLARHLQDHGVNALVLSGGFVSHNAFYLLRGNSPAWAMASVERNWVQKAAIGLLGPFMLRSPPFTEMFFFEDACRIRDAVEMPLVLLGGIVSGANVAKAMERGFEYVAAARALLANPDWTQQIFDDGAAHSHCTHCNLCIAEMDRGGVRCVL